MRKRMIAMLLCIATMLSLCTGFASAASSTIGGALGEVNITNGGYKMSCLSMNGVVRSQSYTYFNFKSASGAIKEIPAYCINPTIKGVPQTVGPGQSIKYIANEASNDPKVVGIIANGYPHRGLSELKLDNKYQAYYATKIALWCYLIDGWSIDRLTVNPSLSGVEKECGEKLLAAAKDIYKRGIWWNRVPQPTITVTADKDSAYPVTIDGKEYLQQVFTADSETWVCDYDIDIGFTMPDEVPEGTRIVTDDISRSDARKIIQKVAALEDVRDIQKVCGTAVHALDTRDREGFSKSTFRLYGEGIRLTARQILLDAHEANNVNFQTDYDKRVEKIGAVVDGCSLLLEYLTICTEEGIISAKKAGIWTKKVTDVKYPAMKWLTSERGRAEKLRAEAERKRLTEQAAALKAVLYPEP